MTNRTVEVILGEDRMMTPLSFRIYHHHTGWNFIRFAVVGVESSLCHFQAYTKSHQHRFCF